MSPACFGEDRHASAAAIRALLAPGGSALRDVAPPLYAEASASQEPADDPARVVLPAPGAPLLGNVETTALLRLAEGTARLVRFAGPVRSVVLERFAAGMAGVAEDAPLRVAIARLANELAIAPPTLIEASLAQPDLAQWPIQRVAAVA